MTPNKPTFQSPDLTQANIDKIAALFPNCITETRDENGALKKVVNFEQLKQMLADEEIAGDEAYEFTWVGKKASILEAHKPIRKTLRPCKEESKNWDTTENLYIEGDNLDALKLLQESYLSKVKMIYIDPPYNTGNDFIYRDKFAQSQDDYDEDSGVYDDEGNRLFKNTESNGRFHSDWCSMIYSRLLLARNLLTDDGVIFISIDDNEVHNLRKMCDEVFGEGNFVANIIWQKVYSPRMDVQGFSTSHDYILCYMKQNTTIKRENFKQNANQFLFKDEKGNYRRRSIRKEGSNSLREDAPNSFFALTAPDGIEVFPIKPDGTEGNWRWSKATYKENLQQGFVEWVKTNDLGWQVYAKQYLKETPTRPPQTLWLYDEVNHNHGAVEDLKKLMKGKFFDSPKPKELLEKMLKIATENNSIILDFFSGSSTTAHAVMQLNAEDGGNRKFIMVQFPEITYEGKEEKYIDADGIKKKRYIIDENTGYPVIAKDSEARKAGYWTISQIGKERIRRAGEKIVTSLELQVTKKNSEVTSLELQKEMIKYGCVKLSKLDRLAKVDEFDSRNLSSDKEIAERRTFQPVKSDEAGGGVNSVEHSGGERAANSGGISTISAHSQGLSGGAGDTTADLCKSELPCQYRYKSGAGTVNSNKQNDYCPYENTRQCPIETSLKTADSKLVTNLDTGFRVFKVDDSNMTDVYYSAGEYSQDMLANLESNIKSDRTDLDLFFGCILDWGLPLSLPYTSESIENCTVHTYNNGDLIACFNENIPERLIKNIANRKPLRAVFRDSCFKDSPSKINVTELFKLLSPDTSVRVI